MSTAPRELPGFYYDEERKRYFPLTQKKVQEVKRAKISTSLEDKSGVYWKKCTDIYNNFDPRSDDVIPFDRRDLPLIASITDLRANGANMFKNVLELSPKELVTTNGKNEPSYPVVYLNGNLFRTVLSDSTVLDFSIKDDTPDWVPSKCTPVNSVDIFSPDSQSIKMVSIKKFPPNHLVRYYTVTPKNRDVDYGDDPIRHKNLIKHIFELVRHPVDNKGHISREAPEEFPCCTVTLNEETSARVKDTVITRNGPILAVGNKLLCLKWAHHSPQPFFKLPTKSDITAIQYTQCNEVPCKIFCGTRNGHIYCLEFKHKNGYNGPSKERIICIKGLHGISSVVSIHAFTDQRLLVSAIKKNTTSQHLMVVDALDLECSIPQNEASVVFLKTKFSNATKDSEYLDISEDQQFVLYGKGEDFEVFSLRHREYQRNDAYVCYPFASFEDYIKNDNPIDLKKYRLSNVSFSCIDKTFQDTYSFSVEDHPNLQLQYRISDENSYQEESYRTKPLIVMTFKLIERSIDDMDTPIMINACVYVF